MPKNKSDQDKSKEELLKEVKRLRRRNIELDNIQKSLKINDKKIQSSERQLRSIFDNSPDFILTIGKDLRIKFINHVYPGFKMRDIVGASIFKFVLPLYHDIVKEKINHVFKTGNFQSLIIKAIEPNKKVGWYENRIAPVKESAGISSVLVISANITERVLIEERLKKNEERYEMATTAARIWVWDWNLETNEFYIDPKIMVSLGYGDKQLPTGIKKWWRYVHKDDRKSLIHIAQSCIEGNKSEWIHQHRMIHKNGSVQWMRVHGRVIRNTQGKALRLVGTNTDINRQKQVDIELEESREKFISIFKNAGDGIMYLSNKLKVLEVNPAFTQLTGIPRKDVVGKTGFYLARKFLRAKDLPRILGQLRQLLQKKTLRPYVVEFRGKYLEILSRGNVSTKGFTAVYRDITERKKEEEKMHQLEDQLRQAQKMEAIGALAGGIAHDFNNILGAIMGYTELSLFNLSKKKQVEDNLTQILKSTKRAKEMVQQILMFSRKGQKTMAPLYITNIIEDSLKLIRSSIPKTIKINYKTAKELKPVTSNPTQIHQVIMNLCANSAYSMKESGGVIEVDLKELILDSDKTKLKNLSPGTFQQIRVSDTGCGMSRELQERIFEPYFTTKENGTGTGMGLAVVHGIIKNHGGEIMVKSKPGKGTSFIILLPVKEEGDVPEIGESAKIPLQGGTERILLVDDEKSLANIGKKLLKTLGYKVTARTNSVNALNDFRRHADNFDLVITDMTMPNQTGVQLAEQIHNIRPDIPVILCTGFSERINEENYRSKGIDGFIMKPIEKKEIATLIRGILD